MQIKRFIDIHVPIFACNLKCSYCYVSHMPQKKVKPIFEYGPETVKKALTQDRLGGVCHFNVCGMGETLIPEELIDYIRVILENGHTVMIVTNGTLTKRFEEYMELPDELKKRLGFKFSFHYLEMKRLNMMEIFFNNVNMVKKNGCSFSVELTANDSYEPYINEIKECCLKHVGALCHISVPRNEATDGISLYSRHNIKEFYNVWKEFDSPMFELKIRHWEEVRKEFCYAGLWSGLLNLGTGEFNACYRQPGPMGNLFQNPEKEFVFCPVGKCEVPHCFNGHSFLAWGVIPEISEESYLDIRDRIDKNGNHWINTEMRDQFKERLFRYNELYADGDKRKVINNHVINKQKFILKKIKNKIKKGVNKLVKG